MGNIRITRGMAAELGKIAAAGVKSERELRPRILRKLVKAGFIETTRIYWEEDVGCEVRYYSIVPELALLVKNKQANYYLDGALVGQGETTKAVQAAIAVRQ
jgi:hypothetical protein